MSRPDQEAAMLLAGIDSLYVSYFIDGIGIDWDVLAWRKEETQHERRDFATVEIGGREWALLPRGQFPYTYVLKRPDVTLSLAEHMRPRCLAQFHSEALWTEGPERLLADLRDWFRAVGTMEQAPERLSRVDWAFDVAQGAPDFIADHVLTRAKKDAAWRSNGQLQSLQFGKGDTVVRIYNKVAEIEEESAKAWLYELWGQREGVWRVEFQIRRQRLRAAGIETFADLRTYEGDLLHELSGTYASLRVPTGDSNRSRWPLHPLWRSVRDAIGRLDQKGLVRSYDPDPPLAFAEDRSLKSVAGMLKNLAAIRSARRESGKPVELPELLDWLGQKLPAQIPAPLWREEVEKRIEKRRLGL